MNRNFKSSYCWALALAFGFSLAMASSASAQVQCWDGTGTDTGRYCFDGVTNDRIDIKGCGRDSYQYPVTHFDLWDEPRVSPPLIGRWGMSTGDRPEDRSSGQINSQNKRGNRQYLSFHHATRQQFGNYVKDWVLDVCQVNSQVGTDHLIKQFMVKVNKAGTRAKLKLRFHYWTQLENEERTRKVKFRSNGVYYRADR